MVNLKQIYVQVIVNVYDISRLFGTLSSEFVFPIVRSVC